MSQVIDRDVPRRRRDGAGVGGADDRAPVPSLSGQAGVAAPVTSVVRREHDGVELRCVRGVGDVVDVGDRRTGDGDLAVAGDAWSRRQVVAGGEGGGGGGGSGNRDTGEQNARLAHCRVLFSQWLRCRPDAVHPVQRRLRLFVDALSSAAHAPESTPVPKETGVAKATPLRR